MLFNTKTKHKLILYQCSTINANYNHLLLQQLRDPYPALRAEACAQLQWLACEPAYEQGMKFYAAGLARSLLPCLRHRHARVRAAAVLALWKVSAYLECLICTLLARSTAYWCDVCIHMMRCTPAVLIATGVHAAR
jgi:hypothetical protein